MSNHRLTDKPPPTHTHTSPPPPVLQSQQALISWHRSEWIHQTTDERIRATRTTRETQHPAHICRLLASVLSEQIGLLIGPRLSSFYLKRCDSWSLILYIQDCHGFIFRHKNYIQRVQIFSPVLSLYHRLLTSQSIRVWGFNLHPEANTHWCYTGGTMSFNFVSVKLPGTNTLVS